MSVCHRIIDIKNSMVPVSYQIKSGWIFHTRYNAIMSLLRDLVHTLKIQAFSQPKITCSNLIIKTLEQGVKYVQSEQLVSFWCLYCQLWTNVTPCFSVWKPYYWRSGVAEFLNANNFGRVDTSTCQVLNSISVCSLYQKLKKISSNRNPQRSPMKWLPPEHRT